MAITLKNMKHLIAVLLLVLPDIAWADNSTGSRDLDLFLQKTGVGDGVVGRMMDADLPLAARSTLPRRVVIEERHHKDSATADGLIHMTLEQTQTPVQGGLINAVRVENRAVGPSSHQQLLSLMGLIDIGLASISKFQYSTMITIMVGKGFITVPVNTSSSMELQAGLRAFETNLGNVADPKIGEKWRLFTSTTFILPRDARLTQDLDMECQATDSFEAAKLHEALRGSARRVICAGQAPNGQTFSRSYAFLEEYRWYVLLESVGAGGARNSRYVIKEVEH